MRRFFALALVLSASVVVLACGDGTSIEPSAFYDADGSLRPPSVADDAISIEVEIHSTVEPDLPGPDGGCSPRAETIDVDLATGDLVAHGCLTDTFGDGGEIGHPTVLATTTLTSGQRSMLGQILAGYHEVGEPSVGVCAEGSIGYSLRVTTAKGTTIYWDVPYACERPTNVRWVAPRLKDLFSDLRAWQ